MLQDKKTSPYGLIAHKAVFVLLPLIILLVLQLLFQFRLSDFVPHLNDEVSWTGLTLGISEYGHPLGYWGYNGSHAEIGTFATWNIVITRTIALIPSLLLRLFPNWNGYNVLFYSNLIWLCAANLIFVLLTRPGSRQLRRLTILYLILYLNHTYSAMAMSESLRFSMAVILAGIFYCLLARTLPEKWHRVVLYGLSPVVLILCTSAHVLFGALIPLWFYCVYAENRTALRRFWFLFALAALILSALVTLVPYLGLGRFSAAYFGDSFSGVMDTMHYDLRSGLDLYRRMISTNLHGCSLSTVFSMAGQDHGLVSYSILFYYLAMAVLFCSAIVSGFRLYKARKAKNDCASPAPGFLLRLAELYLPVVFLAAFILLYNTTDWTFIRGLNVALIFALCLEAMQEEKIPARVLALAALLGLMPFFNYFQHTVIPQHMPSASAETYQQVFAENILLDPDADPWENTVAGYGSLNTSPYLYLPRGTGFNLVLGSDLLPDSRYLAVSFNDKSQDDEIMMEKLSQEPFKLLYQDDTLALFENTQR